MITSRTKLLCSAIVMIAVVDGFAADRFFYDNERDGLWGTEDNWAANGNTDPFKVPTEQDRALHTKRRQTLTVAGKATAFDLIVTHSETGEVAVVTGGVLDVVNDVKLGTFGTAVGRLKVDGGSVKVGRNLALGPVSAGIVELNSGSIDVTAATWVGNKASGTLTSEVNISGGSYRSGANFIVGRFAGGTLNMTGGNLVCINGAFQIGENDASGVVNLRDGHIRVGVLDMDRGTGSGAFNLLGGILQVDGGHAGAMELLNEADLHIEGGTLQWKGNRISNFTDLVDGGFISWANGMDAMLAENPDASWINGSSILYADFDAAKGYTKVWAFDASSQAAVDQSAE